MNSAQRQAEHARSCAIMFGDCPIVTPSKTVKDCRLSDKHAPIIRVPSKVGVTGGYVSGQEVSLEYETPIRSRRVVLEAPAVSRRARKAIARKREMALTQNVGRLAR